MVEAGVLHVPVGAKAVVRDTSSLRIGVPRDTERVSSTLDDLYAVRERSVVEHRERLYRFPFVRASLAFIFLVGGFSLCISGIALLSLAMGIVGALLVVPGAYVTFVYVQIWRRVPAYLRDQDRWMDVVEEDPY